MDPTIYITVDGEYLDEIVWKHYGTLDGNLVEQVYDVNPELAQRGLFYPSGVRIVLPVIEPPDTTPVVRIF